MSKSLFLTFGILVISFLLTLFLTAWIRQLLLKRSLLDVPNERSSHKIPTPRGGGWALLLVILPSLLVFVFLSDTLTRYMGLLAGILTLITVSWLDDRRGLHPMLRLMCHVGAAIMGSLSFPLNQTVFSGILPFWLDRTIMIVGWAWFINLYNFMDGIDGITGIETISIATASCLVMDAVAANEPFYAMLTLMLTGCSLGFLAFNWHPAKIFLGDVGSVPLGYLCGFLLIALALKGYLAAAIIIPLYYLADSGITLVKRAVRGEKIWQAHRQHFYQKAANSLGRHDKVVFSIIATNIALLGIALLATSYPIVALALAATIVAILIQWMHKTAQGPEKKL